MFQHIAKFLFHVWALAYQTISVQHVDLKAAFVHLKRVIVTPAVYQPLARLDPSFRY
jgi:hypothetical protein